MKTASLLARLSLMGLLSAGFAAYAPAAFAAADVVKKLDKDNDGTLDLAEVKAAAAAKFDALNKDPDHTLDHPELKGVLEEMEIVKADPDKDGTLDKNEYLVVVEKLFVLADPDKDGTLDAKELETEHGKKLQTLIH
ncbi:EF-hand domain-containing protein [Methylocella sp.]|uniref:EF-hand domain-containing protein n=1 Tax=Methylocella sp. TaxID=1978226 RepID=UPI003784BA63